MLLDDRLAQASAHAARDRQPFCVLMVDLDRFKVINDSLGHHAGDEVLQEVARRLNELVRSTDTVARVGGDEFVIWWIDPAAARPMPNRSRGVRTKLLQRAHRVGGVDIRTQPASALPLSRPMARVRSVLLAHADAAMYCAKQRGRNNYPMFHRA